MKNMKMLKLLCFYLIVPPQDIQIFEQTGMNVRGEVGPYREGSTVELTCIARDGKFLISLYGVIM
jgi:hypothetical protein